MEATVQAQGIMYKAFVQSFLIYWSAIWVFTGGRAQSARGIPSSVSNNDYGDDGLAYYNQGVEVPTGSLL